MNKPATALEQATRIRAALVTLASVKAELAACGLHALDTTRTERDARHILNDIAREAGDTARGNWREYVQAHATPGVPAPMGVR